MKEKGGFAFISTVKLHFSLVFWVRNAWKMWFSRYRSKIKHFSLVSNPKYAGKVNFTVSKNKPTHFLHLCGNPSKKIVIYLPNFKISFCCNNLVFQKKSVLAYCVCEADGDRRTMNWFFWHKKSLSAKNLVVNKVDSNWTTHSTRKFFKRIFSKLSWS